MLPPGSPSTTVVRGTYLAPDDVDRALLQDYELGGVDLNDSSLGLQYQLWRIEWQEATKDVVIAPSNGSVPPVVLFNAPQLTEVSFTFDQLMRPQVAYVEAGVAKMRWFEPVQAAIVVDAYFGISSPFMCLDERRPLLLGTGDTLFAYIRNMRVYYRQQRERFEVEHALMSTDLPPGRSKIMNLGITNKGRLQATVRTESS